MSKALQIVFVAGLMFCLGGAARASIAFDFDSGTSPPFVGQSIPLDYTADGKVDIFVPFVANGATNFVLDSVAVAPAVPEPGRAAMVAVVTVALLLRARPRARLLPSQIAN